MAKVFQKTKAVIQEIHWPGKKEVAANTLLAVLTTLILSLLIMVWTSGIDKAISWILSFL